MPIRLYVVKGIFGLNAARARATVFAPGGSGLQPTRKLTDRSSRSLRPGAFFVCLDERCLTSWIRLDDQIGHHPKCLQAGLSTWLYVCCIGYAQKFLTDGYIPNSAVSSITGGVKRPLFHFKRLVTFGLLEQRDNGYQIHDYLDFNDSAVVVRQKRDQDKQRKKSERNPSGHNIVSERNPAGHAPLSGRIPEVVLARAPASHPIPSHPISLNSNNKLKREANVSTTSSNGNGHPDARSKRPIFTGQRLTVFEWQLDDCLKTLGPHADTFGLDEWFFALDQFALSNGLVIPKRDNTAWLLAQLLEEAQRRGLPLKLVTQEHKPDMWAEIAKRGPSKRP